MKKLTFIFCIFLSFAAKAQKVESIYFNLYTDSLKKGVYNYINIDGKLSNGNYLPLMTDEVVLTSSVGKWDGNSLILDRMIKIDTVIITAALKSHPDIKKSVTIHVKKIEVDPPLKTEDELLNDWRKNGSKRKN